MNLLMAGGILGSVAAAWGQIKNVWTQLSSLVIVQVRVQQYIADAMLVYLQDNAKTIKIGPQTYTGTWAHVKAINRTQLIAFRLLGQLGSFYIHKRKLLWVSPGAKGRDSSNPEFADLSPNMLKISFIRRTFNADALVSDAVKHYNRIRDDISSNTTQRHFIRRVYGLSKKRAMSSRGNDTPEESTKRKSNNIDTDYRNAIPLGYEHRDIGTSTDHALETLALSSFVNEAVLEARRWKVSEKWYREHSLPWRRGWLLYGQPGTGKTALVRALAEELDLPVYIYDLASLANDEFQLAWRQMLSSVPCIALIEDIDAVFDGRKTVVGDLTFDCLLNCLDGIERADGLFTIVTTNNPDKLDAALGIADETGKSTRPGRVDKAILMDCPDKDGRLKMAKRILAEYPIMWDSAVNDGEGETGAQFQERCASIALRLYWTEKEKTC